MDARKKRTIDIEKCRTHLHCAMTLRSNIERYQMRGMKVRQARRPRVGISRWKERVRKIMSGDLRHEISHDIMLYPSHAQSVVYLLPEIIKCILLYGTMKTWCMVVSVHRAYSCNGVISTASAASSWPNPRTRTTAS